MMRDIDRTEFWFNVFEWMQILSPLIWPALALLILLLMSSCGHAAECQHSADAVKAKHPGAWSTYSLRVPGHLGQHCWMTKEERREVMRNGDLGRNGKTVATHETRPARAAQAVPLPRARPDFEIEAALKEPRADPAEGRRFADEFLPPTIGMPIAMSLWQIGWR